MKTNHSICLIIQVVTALLAGILPFSATGAGQPCSTGLTVGSPMDCTAPQSLSSSGITATSAILDWTPSGTETSWTLRYGPPGFNPVTSGTEISGIITHPYTLNPPLVSGTVYDWYVRADCSGLIQSPWSAAGNFTTLCAGSAGIPFLDDFETGYPVGTPIAGCWSQEVQGNPFYSTTGSYVPAYSGAFNAFLYYGSNTWLFRRITLTAGQTYDVSAMGRMDPLGVEGDATLELRCGTAASSASMIYPLTSVLNMPDNDYIRVVGSFTPAASGDYYIGIHGTVNLRPWGLGVDDVTVTAVSCPTPSFLTATTMVGGTAELAWGSTGAASYDIEIGVEGFSPTGSPTYSGVTSPYLVSGLGPGVQYTFYVRSHCNGSGNSGWSTPLTFKALCGLPGAFPFSEGFESGYTTGQPIGGCWIQEWSQYGTPFLCNEGGFIPARTGTKNAFLYYGNNMWMMRDFHFNGGVQYAVSCWAMQDPAYGTYGDGVLSISYGTTPEASAMTQEIVPATILPQSGYLNVNGLFTPPATGTYYLGFHGVVNGFPWGIALDDILVDVAPVIPNTLGVGNETVSNSECFNATATITIAGSGNPFTVSAGGQATFIAGQNIRFLSGTTVVPGGMLHGYIDPGGPWCPFGESLLTGTEEARPLSADSPGRYRIWPNPTTGDFTLEVKDPEDPEVLTLEIFNLSGMKTAERTLPAASRQKVGLGWMPAGLYLVRVMDGKHVETLKLIKTD